MPTPQAPAFTDAEDTIYSVDELIAWTQPIPALAGGVASLVSSTSNSASLSATNATGGIPAAGDVYVLQWERKTGAGGTYAPVPGATALTLNDTGLGANVYFYRLKYTDRTGSSVYSNEVQADLAGVVLLIHDDATGADTADITGRAPNVLNTPGNTWTAPAARPAGIIANQFYFPIDSSQMDIQTGVADGEIETVVTIGSASTRIPRVFFRKANTSNYDRVDFTTGVPGSVNLAIVVGGSIVESASAPINLSSGSTHTLRVVYNGTSIKVYLNGNLVIDFTSSNNTGNTLVSIGCTGSSGVRFDDFKVRG